MNFGLVRPLSNDLKNQCPICGNYRIDKKPPELHRCQKCGFEGGLVVHTDECPGCQYLKEQAKA